MAAAKGGVALLTSAEAAESSLEDERWGGGHGVFTHYLLEGIRGHADGFGDEKDGIVSVGELFEYVRAQVRRDTDGRQNPAIGTTHFDRRLPMAVTGDSTSCSICHWGTGSSTSGGRSTTRRRCCSPHSSSHWPPISSATCRPPTPIAAPPCWRPVTTTRRSRCFVRRSVLRHKCSRQRHG